MVDDLPPLPSFSSRLEAIPLLDIPDSMETGSPADADHPAIGQEEPGPEGSGTSFDEPYKDTEHIKKFGWRKKERRE